MNPVRQTQPASSSNCLQGTPRRIEAGSSKQFDSAVESSLAESVFCRQDLLLYVASFLVTGDLFQTYDDVRKLFQLCLGTKNLLSVAESTDIATFKAELQNLINQRKVATAKATAAHEAIINSSAGWPAPTKSIVRAERRNGGTQRILRGFE